MTTSPLHSVPGYVTMADGSSRPAFRNTYKVTTFSADGTTATTAEVERIEFRLFVNMARGNAAPWRKASARQAATFVPTAEDGR